MTKTFYYKLNHPYGMVWIRPDFIQRFTYFSALKIEVWSYPHLIPFYFKRTTFIVNEFKIYTRNLTIFKIEQEVRRDTIKQRKLHRKTSFVEEVVTNKRSSLPYICIMFLVT